MAIDPNLLIPLLPSFAQAVEPDEDNGIAVLKPRVKVESEKFEKPVVTAEVTKSLCELGFLRRGKKKGELKWK